MTHDLRVAALNCYPVKSCAGIALSRADIGPMGIRYDRQWMVVDERGMFVAQRGDTGGRALGIRSLGQVETAIGDGTLTLRVPGMDALRVPLAGRAGDRTTVGIWSSRVTAIDQGREASDWFSAYLSRERPGRYRLVRMPDDEIRAANRGHGRLAFADGYPFLVISTASLADLNRRMAVPLPMDRFRPSLVIETGEPYLEDRLAAIRIGKIEMRGTTRCVRCPIPTFDQRTGARGKEPLRTLATYRRSARGVVFGRNFNHVGTGSLAVGDPVEVAAWEGPDGEPMLV